MARAWSVKLVSRKTDRQVELLDVLTLAVLRVESKQHPQDFAKLVRMVAAVAKGRSAEKREVGT